MATEYSYRKRSRERKRRRKRRIIIISICAAVLAALIIAVICVVRAKPGRKDASGENADKVEKEIKDSDKIEDGVFIQEVPVGGKNYADAVRAVTEYVETLGQKELTVDVNGNEVSTTLGRLGVSCDADQCVRKAFDAKENESVGLGIVLDDEAVAKFVKNKCSDYNIKAKNAGLKRKDGEFTVTGSKAGKIVDEAATVSRIKSMAASSASSQYAISVTAVIKEVEPEYTSEDMEKCDDILGKFSTKFSEGEIQRSHNLRNAVGFIDGSVIYPGDTFSVADTIYPLSEDNGYEEAPSYADGEVVESLGGGVCQVSTTLYNAVLRAELQIVERMPHSMVVTYVQPSMDAAIAGDYKDLKFSNNTNAPVYIQGVCSGGILTFTVYGNETRPEDRSIGFESVKVETIQPGDDIITVDKTKDEGYESVTQQAHVGYVANLYKIVYENGVEQSREKVNYSKYNAEPRHVTVGAKKEEEKKDEEDKEDEEGKDKKKGSDKDKDNEGKTKNKKAGVSPAPEATPAQPEPTAEPQATEAPVQTEEPAPPQESVPPQEAAAQ